MARIEKASTFLPISRSGDRSQSSDPWRDFESSLAVQFTSWRRGGWSTDNLDPETQVAIIKALEARNSVALAEMKLLSRLQALVTNHSSSAGGGQSFPPLFLSDDRLFGTAREIVLSSSGGSLGNLLQIFGELDASWRELGLLAKGLVEVAETRRAGVELIFSLGRKVRIPAERVPAVANGLVALVEKALFEIDSAEKAAVRGGVARGESA